MNYEKKNVQYACAMYDYDYLNIPRKTSFCLNFKQKMHNV